MAVFDSFFCAALGRVYSPLCCLCTYQSSGRWGLTTSSFSQPRSSTWAPTCKRTLASQWTHFVMASFLQWVTCFSASYLVWRTRHGGHWQNLRRPPSIPFSSSVLLLSLAPAGRDSNETITSWDLDRSQPHRTPHDRHHSTYLTNVQMSAQSQTMTPGTCS